MLRRIVREKKGSLFCVRRYAAEASPHLRAQPWAFNNNTAAFQKTQHRTTTARYNFDMAAKADVFQFPDCFALAAEMKQKGITPTISTYNTLLRALAHGGYAPQAFAVFEDMLSFGVSPDATSFNHLITAHRTETTAALPAILQKMEELGVAPNATTYTLLIDRFVADENLEAAIQHLYAMKAHNLLPEVAAAQAVIILAANRGYPRLAVDLAMAFEEDTVRKVEDSVWVACLHSSATELYADGVIKSWYILVRDLAISPDEGLCTLVLHTAARNGLPDLATDALRVLKVLEVPWMEHHLAPLFEAFCRAKRFQEAFSSLAIMRQSDIDPTMQTASPIIHLVQEDAEILDDLWAVLDQMHQEEKRIDITAFNALLQASLSTQPLTRALSDYNRLKSYGFTPNAETFHVFIDGCLSAANIAYGELAFRQLKEVGTPMDHDVFGKMITLHLTQDTYDDAFLYLEDMQSAGHVPAQHLYEALVLKCAAAGDSRYVVALDEMKEAGHKIHPDFVTDYTQLYDRAIAAAQVTSAESRTQALQQILLNVGPDESAQNFIETGGLSSLEIKREK
ncbi:hypothetical protein C8R44DRAFT_717856 [Mycena epipterygia]|nr:hypothetical protein C8R44DRAFT_717856 [Mycena epipterygia]